jgi:tRNA nucleotidyltransferase/poly(A) polymerase|tara:strand:+ start:1612 stop:2331 length:720 start_codon:yes stop_codon:yes gene_type:complete
MKIFEVGGCVRDELLGLESKDIDFTVVLDDTSLSVDEGWDKMLKWLRSEGFELFLETKDCFTVRGKFPKGHKNEGLVGDFVMSRKEVGVIPGTRKPILELGTLEDDLMRRDFTVNSLCKDEDGKIIDLFEGVYDLRTKVLRTPLDPMITLLDDPLRMLRGLRFSITKGFIIDSKLWDSMLDPRVLDKLKEVVSHERMREEITKMMKHDTIKSLKLLNKIPGLMEIVFSNGMWLMPTTKK